MAATDAQIQLVNDMLDEIEEAEGLFGDALDKILEEMGVEVARYDDPECTVEEASEIIRALMDYKSDRGIR